MIVLGLLLGLIASSFVIWRKLKEDYLADQIFYFTLLLVAGAGLGWFIAYKLAKPLSFWGFVLGIVLSSWYAVPKLQLKFFEVSDGIVFGVLWLLFFLYLFQPTPYFAPVVFALAAYFYFERNYRRFLWYPSGKIGFVGFASLVVFSLVRLIIDFYFFLVVKSFPALTDLLLAGTVLAISILVIYQRKD